MTCHGKFDIKNLKFFVWQITSMRLKTFCLLEFKDIAHKFQTLHWYWKGGLGGGGEGRDEFFCNSFFFFDQPSVLSVCNNIVVNNLYGSAKLFKPCLNFSTLSPLFKPLAEKNDLLLPNFPIH